MLLCCSPAPSTLTLKISQVLAVPGTGHMASQGVTFPVLLHCSQDSELPTLISSVHRSRHLVMPEHPSHCEFQRGSVELGLGAAGEMPRELPGVRMGLPGLQRLTGGPMAPPPSWCLCSAALDAATPSSLGWRPGRPAEEAGGGEAGCPPGLHVTVIVLIPPARQTGGRGSGSTVAAAGVGLEWLRLLPPPPHGTDAGGQPVQASQRLRNVCLGRAQLRAGTSLHVQECLLAPGELENKVPGGKRSIT